MANDRASLAVISVITSALPRRPSGASFESAVRIERRATRAGDFRACSVLIGELAAFRLRAAHGEAPLTRRSRSAPGGLSPLAFFRAVPFACTERIGPPRPVVRPLFSAAFHLGRALVPAPLSPFSRYLLQIFCPPTTAGVENGSFLRASSLTALLATEITASVSLSGASGKRGLCFTPRCLFSPRPALVYEPTVPPELCPWRNGDTRESVDERSPVSQPTANRHARRPDQEVPGCFTLVCRAAESRGRDSASEARTARTGAFTLA